MIPPWQKYPKIPLGSMGWRMGYGEDYWIEFNDWFASETLEAKKRYAAENPEPPGWHGFYSHKGLIVF